MALATADRVISGGNTVLKKASENSIIGSSLLSQSSSSRNVVVLVCKYGEWLKHSSGEQIKWFLNKNRLKNSSNNNNKNNNAPNETTSTSTTATPNSGAMKYTIIQSGSSEANETLSTLIIENYNAARRHHHAERVKCQYKGLARTVRLVNVDGRTLALTPLSAHLTDKVIYKQPFFSLTSATVAVAGASISWLTITSTTATAAILLYFAGH